MSVFWPDEEEWFNGKVGVEKESEWQVVYEDGDEGWVPKSDFTDTSKVKQLGKGWDEVQFRHRQHEMSYIFESTLAISDVGECKCQTCLKISGRSSDIGSTKCQTYPNQRLQFQTLADANVRHV